jgi:DeoR/GlpR family transcriptional regulator of sugar metabolism
MGSLLDFDYREVRIDQAIIDNSRQLFFCGDGRKQ